MLRPDDLLPQQGEELLFVLEMDLGRHTSCGEARNHCCSRISGGTRPVVRRGTTAVHGSRAASSGVARSHCCSCISGGSRPPAILRLAVKSLQVKRAVTWLEFRASRAVNYLCISREPDPLCIHLVAP